MNTLRIPALLALATHLVAGLAMLLVLGQGLQTAPVDARLRFLAEESGTWRAAWLTWHAAAASIVWFFHRFGTVHGGRSAFRIAAVALVADLSAQWLLMFVAPAAAARLDIERLGRVERTAVLLTGGFANALYTAATAVCIVAGARSYPGWVSVAGWTVVAAGTWLTTAAVFDSTGGMYYSNAILIPALSAWLCGIALSR